MIKKINTILQPGWWLVVTVFIFAVVITGIGGDYSLNDDWMYATPVKSLLQYGQYQIQGEYAPNIFLQVLSGWLVCEVAGFFSFVLLRIGTLLWALAGLYAMYRIVLALTSGRKKAVAGALILLANPLYFNLSFSFMSDVPFVVMTLWAIERYVLFFKRGKTKYRYWGDFFSILAFWIRQPGLLLFLSFEFVYYFVKRKCVKCFIAGFILPLTIAMGIYLITELLIKSNLGNYVPVVGEMPWDKPGKWVFLLIQRYLMTIYYAGLLLIVFLPVVIQNFIKERLYTKLWFWLVLIFNAAIMIYLSRQGRYFPFSGNVIYNFGLGVPLLGDYNYLRNMHYPRLPVYLIMTIGIVVQIYSFLLFRLIAKKIFIQIKQKPLNGLLLFLLLFLAGYTFLMYSFSFFDRYVLPVFAILLVMIAMLYPGWLRITKTGFVLWLAMFAFSILGTKDYLNWNNAVLREKKILLEQGIDRRDIFAGLSQNAWDTGSGSFNGQKYVFAWGEIEGYQIYKRIDYKRYLYGKGELLLLKKIE